MTFSTDFHSTHRANLLALLTHRLDVAKARQDQRLIAELEREYEQLTTIVQPVSMGDRLQQLWTSFTETISEWSKVHIEQTVNGNGRPSWYAYNPQSGQTIFTESKDDMYQWIRHNYWGK